KVERSVLEPRRLQRGAVVHKQKERRWPRRRRKITERGKDANAREGEEARRTGDRKRRFVGGSQRSHHPASASRWSYRIVVSLRPGYAYLVRSQRK
ncbi:hypothetical protein BHE74_00045602, partial [Ensete ventricosum]